MINSVYYYNMKIVAVAFVAVEFVAVAFVTEAANSFVAAYDKNRPFLVSG